MAGIVRRHRHFVARVRKDVEALPEPTRRALAKAVHDNGYWKGQELRLRDTNDPFLGARFKAGDDALKSVLTAQGFDAYRRRYAQGAGGYRLALDAVADRAALYKLEGKAISGLSKIPANTNIINANAQSWDDLVEDAKRFSNPDERLAVIVRNQLNAIASALALLRGSRALSDAEMDYATAVIWRYTGHYSGKEGWEREPLIRIPYPELSEAEKVRTGISGRRFATCFQPADHRATPRPVPRRSGLRFLVYAPILLADGNAAATSAF